MAPLELKSSRMQTLQVPSISMDRPHSHSCSSATSSLNNFNSNLNSDSDVTSAECFSPRSLYAHSFDRPRSSRSLPGGRFRKNMKDITGFTTTEDEFEALPIAVRRKYFSTLERLRFAQNSRSNALHDLPIQRNRKGSLADRRGVTAPIIDPQRKQRSSNRSLRKITRQQSVSSNEVSWFLTLPEKLKEKHFTREEQVVLAGSLRESVILDAADEAIYKAKRRANYNMTPLLVSGSPLSTSKSSESHSNFAEDSSMTAVMYESFRWMDEEEDLDLKLVLDDYHANLDGVVIPTPNSTRRPSFRRQMSISNLPFSRNSISSLQTRSPKFEPHHGRQKSRTLSLMTPRYGHGLSDSISSIDPNATHYQDPEARLKLRVYLASPQKFDEAIEFGFPSLDGVTGDKENKENRAPRSSRDVVDRKSQSTDKGRSFLLNEIDTASLFDDDSSMMDPDSPLTPMEKDLGFRPHHRSNPVSASKDMRTSADNQHHGSLKPALVKQPESYTQVMAGSREMTLRMTLTRPDLRADENTLYGWQSSSKSPLREEPLAVDDLEDDIRGPLGGADGWGPIDKDNGVVKRLWNRVKSTQRKSS